MPLPLLAVAAGAVARTVGTRVVAGAATRAAAGEATGGGVAAGRALQFGGRALQMGAAHRQQPRQPAPAPQGHLAKTADWARNNPIEAGIAAKTIFSGSTLADTAQSDFAQVVQPRQFSG